MLQSTTTSLTGVGGNWIHSGSLGFSVSEEFRASLQPLAGPEMFSEDEEGGLTATYGGVLKLLVETLNTQQDQINTLTKQLGANND